MGYEDKEQIPPVNQNDPPILNLRVYRFDWFVACTIGLVILLGLFTWLARRSELLRDTTVVQLEDKKHAKVL